MKYETVQLDWDKSIDQIEKDLNEIGQEVLNGSIVILKNVFTIEKMDECKKIILEWQNQEPESNPDRLTTNKNWWRRDVNPPSKTPHLFETFCFIFSEQTSDDFKPIEKVFQFMEKIWKRLISSIHSEISQNSESKFRPQVIHYPSGGGYFDWHGHDLIPQGIGMIVGMSKQHRDFETGGTLFRNGNSELDTTDLLDIGDICLFRYDLEHSVGLVDETKELVWGDSGRWTMVLPMM